MKYVVSCKKQLYANTTQNKCTQVPVRTATNQYDIVVLFIWNKIIMIFIPNTVIICFNSTLLISNQDLSRIRNPVLKRYL